MEEEARKSNFVPVSSFMSSFVCKSILQERCLEEAVPQTLILLNSIKTSSNNIIIVFNHI